MQQTLPPVPSFEGQHLIPQAQAQTMHAQAKLDSYLLEMRRIWFSSPANYPGNTPKEQRVEKQRKYGQVKDPAQIAATVLLYGMGVQPTMEKLAMFWPWEAESRVWAAEQQRKREQEGAQN